ncbi:hypothetical protein [Undibacterium sp. TJN19]|uniref:hypothetical protein n=1 Tax=Undibacterium sp. TJN19 TaxID=3413055 RepID=UPI003BF415DD
MDIVLDELKIADGISIQAGSYQVDFIASTKCLYLTNIVIKNDRKSKGGGIHITDSKENRLALGIPSTM